MIWSFAIINGGLAEIFFEKKGNNTKFLGHCYVKKEEYKTKREQKWIVEDTKRFRLSYYKSKYRRLTN
jgi:hypothetical protein